MQGSVFLFLVVVTFQKCLVFGENDDTKWTVPLYLWKNNEVYKTALLPKNPDAYLNNVKINMNYTLAFDEPIAFAHELPNDGSNAVSYPLVTLKLFYSETKDDILQSTSFPKEGDYKYITTIGALALTPGSGYTAAKYVPLTSSYNSIHTDTCIAPLSPNDLNQLLFKDTTTIEYRYDKIDAFAYRGKSIEICQVGMSEAFPSEGGADCAYECNKYGQKHLSSFDTTYHLSSMNTPATATHSLEENMNKADDIILSFTNNNNSNNNDVVVTPRSDGTRIHVSFNYFCCYTKSDQLKVEIALRKFQWPTIEVNFDKPVWRIDSDANTIQHYSIIILLDDASQTKMHALMNDVEAAIRAEGVDIHVPRKEQEPFHSTLGVVNGANFPAITALNAINAAIPPGTWNKTPIKLSKPDF